MTGKGKKYVYNGGEAPQVGLIIDDSKASAEMRTIFEEWDIPHVLSYKEAGERISYRQLPAVYIPNEGTYEGYGMIKAHFLCRFR